MMTPDYQERVYAGVVGKIIGVYLGRPFEGWSNERIEERLGDIDYYVHDQLDVPLVVTDDDISGTFTFIRAFEDHGFDASLTPKQIGDTWLNYLIKERTILWWGGLGNSTEHTAYLRLVSGIDAPMSGAIETNGRVVAEQIGAQIFIDGWAMICPGDPERAADFAARAARVSHDGEAVYGAQVLAAMEAAAFVERDTNRLLDIGTAQIPGDSVLYRMIGDVRDWHAKHGDDWRKTFAEIKAQYGYDRYGGNVHIVPNHALIVQALLHGNDDFGRALMIVNTSGWDTDCNSGNLGCLLGIQLGLEGIDAGPDFRTPFSDLCYLPSADSGGGISDAGTQATRIARMGCALSDAPFEEPPARFHFRYPGSVQGFTGIGCSVRQAIGPHGPCLGIHFDGQPTDEMIRATTPTFMDSLDTARYFEGRGYALMTSPSLTSGQRVFARLTLDAEASGEARVALGMRLFDAEDGLITMHDYPTTLPPGEPVNFTAIVPDTGGYPIAEIGVMVPQAPESGVLYLDHLGWDGAPVTTLKRVPGKMWHRAWVNGVDQYSPRYPESFRLMQNHGTGLLLYGAREWRDYRMTADVTPHLVRRTGIAARVQGMQRYYALLLTDAGELQLVRELHGTTVLASTPCAMELYRTYRFELTVDGSRITGHITGQITGTADDDVTLEAEDDALPSGGIALVVDEGRTATQGVTLAGTPEHK